MAFWYGTPDRDFYAMRATAQKLSNLCGLYNLARKNKDEIAIHEIQDRIYLVCDCAMFYELDCTPVFNIYTGMVKKIGVYSHITGEIIEIYPSPPKHPAALDRFKKGVINSK